MRELISDEQCYALDYIVIRRNFKAHNLEFVVQYLSV